MKKHLVSLIAILIVTAFLASCERSGTTGASTTNAGVSNPSPTPASKKFGEKKSAEDARFN